MTIAVNTPCDRCIHQRPNIDGWKCCCDAFPDGLPKGFIYKNPEELKECNNGIKFEPKEK